MRRKNAKPLGWIHRSPGTPPYLHLKLYGQEEVTFADNRRGATELAEALSKFAHDDWQLEDMQFLGYRVVGRPRHPDTRPAPHELCPSRCCVMAGEVLPPPGPHSDPCQCSCHPKRTGKVYTSDDVGEGPDPRDDHPLEWEYR